MSFITANDTNIIMDESRKISAVTFQEFRDAGATIALEFVSWADVEQQRGVRDWREIDEVVNRVRSSGLKVILQGPTTIPPIFPDDWYCLDMEGHVMRQREAKYSNAWTCLSPWNDKARWYQYQFIHEMCQRYNSEDVLCIFSHSQEGEALLPAHEPSWLDPAAMRSFDAWTQHDASLNDNEAATIQWLWETLSELVLDLQRIYIQNPHRELFMTLHPAFMVDPFRASANINIEAHFENILRHLAPGQLNWLVYSYFPDNFIKMRPYIERVRSKLGVTLITGSEWPEGLVTNIGAARDAHIHALLTSPLHEQSGHKTVEPWAYDNIRTARAALLEARCTNTAE